VKTGADLHGKTPKRAVKMAERWKAWKDNTRLSTAPWKSPQTGDSHIFTAPAAVVFTYRQGLEQQKPKPFTQKS